MGIGALSLARLDCIHVVMAYVSVVAIMPRHWQALAEWISEECDNESILDPMFADMAIRSQTMELIDGWVEELTKSMTAD